jgi:hypothetical protein
MKGLKQIHFFFSDLCALAQPSDLGLIRLSPRLIRLWRTLAESLREIIRDRPVREAHPTKTFVSFVPSW